MLEIGVFLLISLPLLAWHVRNGLKRIQKLEEYKLCNDIISHEIRTPLAILNLASNQINKGFNIERNSERIGKAVAKIEAIIDKKMVPTLINPRELANEVIDLMKPKLDKLRINLIIRYDQADKIFTGEAIPLQQVLINLINNACDAIQNQDRPWIQVTITDKKDKLHFHVTDSGKGIPRKLHRRMMLPYFSRKKGTQNEGLGLAICNQIIKRHNGSLRLNKKSVNTEFIVSLPKLAV